ncbi:PucR family transcriptional regulator [Brevibacillus fluminis]|nr:PucR family transcriptional regulator [Brevibacillus fluminis]
MKFSMKDVMEIDVMKRSTVRSAEGILIERLVESISVIEIPVEDFVRKNEFVLTTAIGCGADVSAFKKFVQDVIDSGAAALGVATGHHVSGFPPEVLELAETRQFPLIELPWELRFADITQSILGALNNWLRHNANRAEELQKQLLHQFLTGGSLTDAAEVISHEMDCAVIILDTEGVINGKSRNSQSLQEKWQSNHDQGSMIEIGKNCMLMTENSLITYKIETANTLHGYLGFELPQDVPIEHFLCNGEEYLLNHAVVALCLWFQRENVIFETELRLRDDFVWMLAKGEQVWELILSRAKALDYQVELPHVCILGSVSNFDILYEKSNSARDSFDQWTKTAYRLIEKKVEEAANSIQRRVMITHHQGRLIIFLEIPMDSILDTVNGFLNRVDSRLQQALPGIIMSWGVGENHAGVKSFHQSFNDARIALDIGIHQKGPGNRSTFTNTGIFRALNSLANSPEIQEITLSTIGSLLVYDQHKELDLVETLIAYIRNQMNVSQTSRALNLHRQSLLYRLRKIESLTDRSLIDPDDLFLLDLSIRLWTTGLVANKKNAEWPTQ